MPGVLKSSFATLIIPKLHHRGCAHAHPLSAFEGLSCDSFALVKTSSGREANAIPQADERQQDSPPDAGMQLIEHDGIRGWMKDLPNPRPGDQNAIYQQGQPDEEPDRNLALMHVAGYDLLPNQNVQNDEDDGHDYGPEPWPMVQRNLAFEGNRGHPVYEAFEFIVRTRSRYLTNRDCDQHANYPGP